MCVCAYINIYEYIYTNVQVCVFIHMYKYTYIQGDNTQIQYISMCPLCLHRGQKNIQHNWCNLGSCGGNSLFQLFNAVYLHLVHLGFDHSPCKKSNPVEKKKKNNIHYPITYQLGLQIVF